MGQNSFTRPHFRKKSWRCDENHGSKLWPLRCIVTFDVTTFCADYSSSDQIQPKFRDQYNEIVFSIFSNQTEKGLANSSFWLVK